jgi:hypothetical protein
MRKWLINYAKDKILNSFRVLEQLGYVIVKHGFSDKDEFVINFGNSITKKDIDFTISDSEDVNRFYLIISIIRKPYLVVNDFIAFDVYLKKNNIPFKDALEGDEINEASIEEYINDYSELFKIHGINLITSDQQFPHYFPEWT